jgi:hypothetical protein
MAPAKSVDFPAGADGRSASGANEGGEGHRDIEAGGWASVPAPAPALSTTSRPRGQRLASLDIFRGITVVVSKSLASPLATFLATRPYRNARTRMCVSFDGRHGWLSTCAS